MKTALVVGSTGLIGSQLLTLLLNDDRYAKVIAVSRQPLEKQNIKLENIIADGQTLGQFEDSIRADDVFCCLGTTIRKAKTKAAFREVDFDYPVSLAKISRRHGTHQFLLVSALGANPSSAIFYNRVKGETEAAILELGFESCHILRPSLLLGPRSEERRGEDAARWVYKNLGFLIPKKYEAIESSKVATAMKVMAGRETKGNHIHESHELQTY